MHVFISVCIGIFHNTFFNTRTASSICTLHYSINIDYNVTKTPFTEVGISTFEIPNLINLRSSENCLMTECEDVMRALYKR